jgi:hypothetical protein
MKTPQLILCLAAAILSGSTALGFAEFARGGLLLSTSARAAYDSRMFGGLGAADDYIFTLHPRLIYRRDAGQIKLDATAGVRIVRYVDFNELDSEDLVTSLELRLPESGASRASGSFISRYDEHSEVNYDVNYRIREKTFSNRIDADIPIGLKTVVLLGASHRDEQRNIFSDQETWNGTVGFRYRDFLGGSAFDVRYRHYEIETTGENPWGVPLNQDSDSYSATFSRPIYGAARGSITYGYRILNRSEAEAATGLDPTSEGSMFSLGLHGPFLPESVFPKVETSLSLGYEKNETPGINDSSSNRFVGSVHIGWNARERTRVLFNARRAVELSVDDLSVEMTRVSLGLDQSVGDFTNATLSIGYEQREYDSVNTTSSTFTRDDDIMFLQAGARYRITKTWSAGANYYLRDTQSNNAIADYVRHLVSVDATYTF